MTSLYVVPTPVGNLGDMTLRAIDVLQQADYVLTEDTRTTGRLLKHFDITTKPISHHQHNEHKTLPGLIERLKGGQRLALVSDAGMPGISDPGFLLVRECIREGLEVECLPGATAFVPALVASGIPCDRFCFEGFLPPKKGRKTYLAKLAGETRTMVFYESPHRLLRTLTDFAGVFGHDRQASVAREISKIHEEHARGTLGELIDLYAERTVKGEITIVVSGLAV
ncbi:MAG: 16S rRNA (cytidine(1402)-2'-O)-methyltransferase [Bacteroidales bacterium]